MAANRINASSEPRGCPHKRKRKSTGSHDAQQIPRNPSVKSDSYIHVHHYLDTGRWGAWFNDPTLPKGSGKCRLYFGTYETEYLAARAQDRAALKFKPYAVKPIRLNFEESDYELDKELRDQLTNEQFRRLLMGESRKCYKRAEPSPCWRIFLTEEEGNGNIPIRSDSGNRYSNQTRTFATVLQEILNRNPGRNPAVNTVAATQVKSEPDSPGEEEDQVCTAKRIKRQTHVAPNQPPGPPAGSLVTMGARSLRSRPVRETAPKAARPVREPSSRGVRRAEGEVRSALQTSEQSSVNPDRLVWVKTGKRSKRKRPSSPSQATSEVADDEPDHDLTMLMVVTVLSEVSSGTSDEKEDLGNELIVQNPSTRRRLNIDLNREPETSSTAHSVEPPHETGGNDEPEVMSAEALMLIKSGWNMA